MECRHANESRSEHDQDVKQRQEIVVGPGEQEEGGDGNHRAEQDRAERERGEHECQHLRQPQARTDEHLDDEESRKADRQRAEKQQRQLDRGGDGLRGTGVRTRGGTVERAQREQTPQRMTEFRGQAVAFRDLGEEPLAVAQDEGQEVP